MAFKMEENRKNILKILPILPITGQKLAHSVLFDRKELNPKAILKPKHPLKKDPKTRAENLSRRKKPEKKSICSYITNICA